MFKRPRIALWLIAVSFTVMANAQRITDPRQLQVQVLNDRNAGVRAKVDLRSQDTLEFTVYTNSRGIALFQRIPAGNYTLIVSVGGTELHRDQISLMNSEGFRTETVRLNLASSGNAPQVVSVHELSVPKNAKEHYVAAVKAIGARHWEKGLVSLKSAIRIYPRYAQAHNAMGVVLAITAKVADAESAFRRAIELNPKFAESHVNLGKLLLKLGRPSEARLQFERNLQLDRGNSSTIALLIDSMILMHDEDAAVSLVRSIHLENTQHTPGLHLELGFALENHSRHELAAEQYSYVLRENASESERREAEMGLSRIR